MSAKNDERIAQLEVTLTRTLQEIANFTHERIPKGWGFGVVICEMNVDDGHGAVLHVSNVDEVGFLSLMEKWVKEAKAGRFHKPIVIPGGSTQ